MTSGAAHLLSVPFDDLALSAPAPDSPALADVHLAHVSDTHLGYEGFAARSPSGANQRGEDVVRAFHQAVSDIIATDPPLVIHSGDVAERPQVPIRYMLAIRAELSRLASIRPDGTRRQLVVIAGNHDASRHLREGCFLELYRGLPGVHIVTRGYEEIGFAPEQDGSDPSLARVLVHAIPHDSLRHLDELAGAQPRAGFVNILTTHGVAEGSELFIRAIGREYPIPTDLMLRDWDYVALGHWHVQGPVSLTGSERTTKVFYAGSTEHIDFSDLRVAAASERAWLDITVRPGDTPTVTRRSFAVRPMMNLPTLDADQLSPEEIATALLARLDAHDTAGAVVRQKIVGLTRDLWALVDLSVVRQRASAALHYRIDPSFAKPNAASDSPNDTEAVSLGDIGRLLTERAQELVVEADREPTLALARQLLGTILEETADSDTDQDSPESTVAESTIAESTVAESTVAESTGAESTVAESTVAESTGAESTVVEPMGAESGEPVNVGSDPPRERAGSPDPRVVPTDAATEPMPAPSAAPRDVFAAINAELNIATLADSDSTPDVSRTRAHDEPEVRS